MLAEVRLICANVIDGLRTLPDESVHCVVTSPPYWGLRDYGVPPTVWGGEPDCEHEWGSWEEFHDVREEVIHGKSRTTDRFWGEPSRRFSGNHQKHHAGASCSRCGAWLGQLGLEPTPEMYVEHLVQVFREVRRVLRRDGTLWLNLGDCYASPGKGGPWDEDRRQKNTGRKLYSQQANRGRYPGLKPKDLVGIPWMVAFALRSDGWWLRSDIIWEKLNCLPESVTDRPTRAHEYVFLLSRRERYFYDSAAIREPHAEKSFTVHTTPRKGSGIESKGERFNAWLEEGRGRQLHPLGRNKRSVWAIPTEPFPGAHFAVFPEALVEPCILAGTSEYGVCPQCGAPWERVIEEERTFESGSGRSGNMPVGKHGARYQGGGATLDVRRGPCIKIATIGWRPTCSCGILETVPATVLDPFCGSGTTLVVAQRLGRHSVGIDINPDYIEMARRRTQQLRLAWTARR